MKYIVTGVAGFIASNLAQRLADEKNQVIGIDKEITSRIPFLNKSELKDNFNFIHSDINKILLSNKFDSIDRVYHLAASADTLKNFKDTSCDLYNNVVGTYSILELMRKQDIQELVYASSSAVYGESKNLISEDMKDTRPISLYGASKLSAEAYINAYVDIYGLKASIFRFASVIGNNGHRGVVLDFVKKLKENPKELEILGDGKQFKSYFMVEDCIEALIKLPITKPSSIYNLGNTDNISVNRIADIIVEEMKLKNVKYKYTGGDRGWIGDAPILMLSIKKALNLGWKPSYNCENSIRKTTRLLI